MMSRRCANCNADRHAGCGLCCCVVSCSLFLQLFGLLHPLFILIYPLFLFFCVFFLLLLLFRQIRLFLLHNLLLFLFLLPPTPLLGFFNANAFLNIQDGFADSLHSASASEGVRGADGEKTEEEGEEEE